MAEEMIVEALPFESDEAIDAESDEALTEATEYMDDAGERIPRRRRFPPVRGVRGMTVQDRDGRRNYRFPARLAPTTEVNRGLAQRDQQLTRLELRQNAAQRNDSAIGGVVTLLIGGGLTAYSLIKASQRPGSDSLFSKWAAEGSAKVATLASASQIATTSAKLLITGRYHRSGVGMAADAYAATQAAGFAIASLYRPAPPQRFRAVQTDQDIDAAASHAGAREGDLVFQAVTRRMYVLQSDVTGRLWPIPRDTLTGSGLSLRP
jgi:hypothetical protein